MDRRGDGSKVLHRPRSQRQKLAYIYFEDGGDGERRRSCSRVMPPKEYVRERAREAADARRRRGGGTSRTARDIW
jgi:hypothetical protein